MANTINTPKAATLEFFGPVDDFYGIGLESLTRDLKRVNGENLEILINSPGGDVFEGIAIGEMLTRRNGETTTTAIGLAASIATVVLMAGDNVQMSESATLMIHDAWAFEAGDAETMQKTSELLDKLSNTIADIYTNQIEKAGKLVDGDREKTKESIRAMMKEEKWLNAAEALDLGLIDKIVDNAPELEEINTVGTQARDNDSKFRACLKAYKNTPTNILNKYESQPMEKDKKTLWQSIKAFFAPELKAEIEAAQEPEAKEETTTIENNEEMTIEEMKAALSKEGFDVSEKVVEVPQEEAKEEAPTVDANAAIMAKLEALEAENAKIKASLKDAKFEASAKSAGGNSEKNTTEKGPNVGQANKSAFASLASLIQD
jgi:ATP-dependent protease ClpP protease subunit